MHCPCAPLSRAGAHSGMHTREWFGGVRRADHIDTEIDVGVVLDLRDEVDDQNDLHSNSAGRDNSAGLASFPASLPGGGGFGPSTTGPAMRMHFGSGLRSSGPCRPVFATCCLALKYDAPLQHVVLMGMEPTRHGAMPHGAMPRRRTCAAKHCICGE